MPHLCHEVDFSREQLALAVPTHLFAGSHDRITDLAQVEEWFAALQAPAKRLEVSTVLGISTSAERARPVRRLHGAGPRQHVLMEPPVRHPGVVTSPLKESLGDPSRASSAGRTHRASTATR